MTEAVRLEMKNIRKSFGGVHAILNGTLSVRAGEVHALMGANGAGKSTMMNILGGIVPQDEGSILIDGRECTIRSARDAAQLGIAFVHQELTTLPYMSVAENVFIDGFPGKPWAIDTGAMHRKTAEMLDRVGCNASPDTPVELLSTGDRQLVEIARCLKINPKTIIFDEPTSSLSMRERERLFSLIGDLRDRGTAIVFISHFLEEVFQVCDRVTVMRNGETISTREVADTSPENVVEEMLGNVHETDRIQRPSPVGALPFLSVNNLSGGPLTNDISFRLHRGEILGLWGLLGSGRTELVRALTGLDPISGGTINLHAISGEAAAIDSHLLRAKTGFVTEDRRGEGVIQPFTIGQNISLPSITDFCNRLGLLRAGKEKQTADRLIDELGILASSADQTVETLSGGNQQKVVFARWLHLLPDFYILDEPTRGLDTGAKTDILKLIVQLASDGAAILMISSELEELMRVADRYLIMNRGYITSELAGNADRQTLMDAVANRGRNGGKAA